MSWHNFTLNNARLTALPAGALWWEAEKLLCVSDLHLGKSERMARRGGLLIPPYDTQETLIRLSQLIDRHEPSTVVCLGDSFDDMEAERGLPDNLSQMIATMMAGRRWVWITGNHDPGPVELSGSWQLELQMHGLTFRHIAVPGAAPGEISGHFHPKASIRGTGTRPCFCYDTRRLIMPAFGTYTGGLRASDPVIKGLFSDQARAVMIGSKSTVIPLNAA